MRFPVRWRPTTRRSAAPAATATLLWDYSDVATRRYLIDLPAREKQGQSAAPRDPAELARRKALEHTKLQRMIDYADTRACLRATILSYFGDPAVRERCDACGNCRPGAIDLRRTRYDLARRARYDVDLEGL